MNNVTVTRSIIHKCYALKLSQSFGEKMAGMAQIVPTYSLPFDKCEELAKRINANDKSSGYWIDRLINYKEAFIPQLKRELSEAK
ncbi:hypothetical protein ACJ8LH_01440 [Serratia sp. CY49633]|uniref:hypothetical protein n=1 Tax=Serratia sp. CY49633 TaxID=3383629 RepID=UPI003F9F3732